MRIQYSLALFVALFLVGSCGDDNGTDSNPPLEDPVLISFGEASAIPFSGEITDYDVSDDGASLYLSLKTVNASDESYGSTYVQGWNLIGSGSPSRQFNTRASGTQAGPPNCENGTYDCSMLQILQGGDDLFLEIVETTNWVERWTMLLSLSVPDTATSTTSLTLGTPLAFISDRLYCMKSGDLYVYDASQSHYPEVTHADFYRAPAIGSYPIAVNHHGDYAVVHLKHVNGDSTSLVSFATNPVSLDPIGDVWSDVSSGVFGTQDSMSFFVGKSWAYVHDTVHLDVIMLGASGTLSKVSTTVLPTVTSPIAVLCNLPYIGILESSKEITVIDVSDSAAPVMVGTAYMPADFSPSFWNRNEYIRYDHPTMYYVENSRLVYRTLTWSTP